MFASQAYIDLVLTFPDVAKVFSLGEKIIFKYKGRFIKISDSGKEKITKNEWKKMLK